MNISKFPFYFVLVASVFPLIGGLLNVDLYHIPFISLSIFTIIFFLYKKKKLIFDFDFLFIVFLITFFVLIINILLSRGFTLLAFGGYVIFASFIFQNFYFRYELNVRTILIFFNFFYKSFLVILLIEILLIKFGFETSLKSLITGYKAHAGYDVGRFISRYIIYVGTNGPNSIFLGSQVAGTLCLLSFIWFKTSQKLNYFYSLKKYRSWKYLSFILFILTLSGTTFFLFFVFLAMTMLLKNKGLLKKFFLILFFIILIYIAYYLIDNQIIYTRVFRDNTVNIQLSAKPALIEMNVYHLIKDMSQFEFYIFIFTRPVIEWTNLPFFSMMFGSGNTFVEQNIYIPGDFGFGAMLFKGGFLFSFFAIYITLRETGTFRSCSTPQPN